MRVLHGQSSDSAPYYDGQKLNVEVGPFISHCHACQLTGAMSGMHHVWNKRNLPTSQRELDRLAIGEYVVTLIITLDGHPKNHIQSKKMITRYDNRPRSKEKGKAHANRRRHATGKSIKPRDFVLIQ